MSFPFYLAAMRRADLADDPRFITPELRLQHLDELHALVQQWIWSFEDMASLDAQLDEAKIATGQLRGMKEFAVTDWASEWPVTRCVSDRHGGAITTPGRPWRFSLDGMASEVRLPALQGEHNDEVLSELGYHTDEIAELRARNALVQPGRSSAAGASQDSAGEVDLVGSPRGVVA
jgi:crotonobetainyl-CoA:carnitine CoA-transferase CaiB-like acyl-CoA transferase